MPLPTPGCQSAGCTARKIEATICEWQQEQGLTAPGTCNAVSRARRRAVLSQTTPGWHRHGWVRRQRTMPQEEAAAVSCSQASIAFSVFPFSWVSLRVIVVLVPILGLNPESPLQRRAHARLVLVHSTGCKKSLSQKAKSHRTWFIHEILP